MNILQSWEDSLALFLPQNFKLFLLVTIKSIIESYKNLFKNFWWLLLGYIIFDQLIIRIAHHFNLPLQLGGLLIGIDAGGIIAEIGYLAVMFLVFLIVRPSIKAKNWDYVKGYGKKFLYFILLATIITLISGERFGLEIDEATGALASFSIFGFDICRALLFLAPAVIISPFFVFATSFILDSDGKFKSFLLSLYRGFKMCVYNAPFCLIVLFILHYLYVGIDYLIFSLLSWFKLPLISFVGDHYSLLPAFSLIKYWSIIFWPLPLCFLINFYVKKLHDQFEVYFNKG